MAILDRHRIARLIELAALERTLRGPERLRRASEVSDFLRAAYDDAGDAARAEFMARIGSEAGDFPWMAVKATQAPRGAGNLGALASGPGAPASPTALVLLRGQAESADIEPGNRLPERGTSAALEWESLYKALDAWDTRTILKAIGPQGWVSLLGTTSGQVARDMGGMVGDVPEAEPTGGKAPSAPPKEPPAPPDLPAPAEATVTAIPWTHPGVIAAGAVIVVAAGVAVYTHRQSERRRLLTEELGRQEDLP